MSKAYLMAELPEHEPRTSQRCALVSVFDNLPSPTFVSLHWTYRAPQTLSPYLMAESQTTPTFRRPCTESVKA